MADPSGSDERADAPHRQIVVCTRWSFRGSQAGRGADPAPWIGNEARSRAPGFACARAPLQLWMDRRPAHVRAPAVGGRNLPYSRIGRPR